MSRFKLNEKIRLGYRYDITDENDNPVYYVEGSLLHLAPKLTLHTMDGTPVAHINRKLISLMPEFDIFIDDEEVAKVKAELALLKRKLKVEGPDWHIDGDYIGHDYLISGPEGEVARAERKLLALTDKYMLDVYDDNNDILALCCAIAMDRDKDEQNEAAADTLIFNNNR